MLTRGLQSSASATLLSSCTVSVLEFRSRLPSGSRGLTPRAVTKIRAALGKIGLASACGVVLDCRASRRRVIYAACVDCSRRLLTPLWLRAAASWLKGVRLSPHWHVHVTRVAVCARLRPQFRRAGNFAASARMPCWALPSSSCFGREEGWLFSVDTASPN